MMDWASRPATMTRTERGGERESERRRLQDDDDDDDQKNGSKWKTLSFGLFSCSTTHRWTVNGGGHTHAS